MSGVVHNSGLASSNVFGLAHLPRVGKVYVMRMAFLCGILPHVTTYLGLAHVTEATSAKASG